MLATLSGSILHMLFDQSNSHFNNFIALLVVYIREGMNMIIDFIH